MFGKKVLCSNHKCKSRKQFKHFINQFKKPIVKSLGNSRDNPIELHCPTCGGQIDMFSSRFAEHGPFVDCVHHGIIEYQFEKDMWYKRTNDVSYRYTDQADYPWSIT
jgi:hypothetical protein